MREKIIKLLTSQNEDDIKIGKEYLITFYKEEIIRLHGEKGPLLLYDQHINEILQCKEKFPMILYYHRED